MLVQIVAAAARHSDCPFLPGNDAVYRAWRSAKLAAYPSSVADIVVDIANLARPSRDERRRVLAAVARCNMAIYHSRTAAGEADTRGPRGELKAFLAAFSLAGNEGHRSSEADGFVAIEVSAASAKRGFIPYTSRPISWHTDGYYNGPDAIIRAMLLHCVRAASEGGENELLDPEIAYIRLRDENPRWIAALMHPQAMSIPPSLEEDGSERPLSVGPVFIVDADGSLAMRYTARGRNIVWRDDADTRAAAAYLERLLKDGQEPLILKARLAPGQGLICNNVLHTRTGFSETGQARLMLRARFSNRIADASRDAT